MADTTFPAHLSIDRIVDLDGVPILTATFTVAPGGVADLELPTGPPGPPGPSGRPRPTFRKMGTLADASVRPTGLGAEDRGRWWHRLDDDGMDVWTGTGWAHSPDAVGPPGPPAAANTITSVETVHRPELTTAAVEFGVGHGAAQQLKVTAPAGPRGAKGPPGASGPITASPDYDPSAGVAHRSVFAFNPGTRKFRAQPVPGGFGPWGWYEADFAASTGEVATDRLLCGTFTVPALPMEWRPICYGLIDAYVQYASGVTYRVVVRVGTTEGEIVAAFRSRLNSNTYATFPVTPWFGDDESTKPLSPTSRFGVVPAGQPGTLVVAVERLGASAGSQTRIGFNRARASLLVWAQPL